ncbi:MAG: MFS transporter [Armatimonadota bacterium]|nr:MFS transporter [Armatimonadota bacterium]
MPPARRALYAFGTFGSSLLQQVVLLWLFYYYAPPPSQGLPVLVAPALLGIAMGIGRFVDAAVDPLVASWSDRHRGPGGRRRPFILVGAPLLALVFALIWRPPDASATTANFIYLSALLGLFFLLFTLVLNPYMALLPEVTRPGRDRVTTAAWQTIFNLAGSAVAFVASAQLAARLGFPLMGLIVAPFGALPLLTASLAVREHPVDGERVPFRVALRLVFGSRRFRIFITGFAALWMGLSMVNLSLALIVTVLMGLPRGAVGTVLGVSVMATLLTTPLVTAAAHRLGTHRALVLAMGAAGVLLPLLAGVGRWPVPVSPAVQGYAVMALAGPPLAALFTLPNTLLADIAQTVGDGRRIEGMFFAFQGLVLNGATSLASVVLGGVLAAFGYDLGLRVVPLLAAGCVAAGIAVFRRFPSDAGVRPRARRRPRDARSR